jgi:hypothetical protein
LDTGASYGNLTADGIAQNLLPYPPGHTVGDLMVGFLPWSCQSGYYGDAFWKYSTPPGTGNDEILHRFIDGTEGTIPQNGRAAYGLMGAEYWRPPTDVITGVLIRGADPLVAPTFPLAGAVTSTPVGDGTYWLSRTTPGFTASSDMIVVCAAYVRMHDWDSGDPDYFHYDQSWSWTAVALDLVTASHCSIGVPPWAAVGWQISARRFAAGATVPAMTNQIRANRDAIEGFEQSVVCFASLGDTNPDPPPPHVTATPDGVYVDSQYPARFYAAATPVHLTTPTASRILYTLNGTEPLVTSRVTVQRTSGGSLVSVSTTPYAGDESIYVSAGGTLSYRSVNAQNEYLIALAVNAGPVSGNSVTLSGTRADGSTVTITWTGGSQEATYPTATTWTTGISGLDLGTTIFTVADGTDSIQIAVDNGKEQTFALGMGLRADAADVYALVANPALGGSFLAGPWSYIDAPIKTGPSRIRFTQAQTSAFTASWAEARTQLQQMGYASISSFVAAWTNAEQIASSHGVTFSSAYVQPIALSSGIGQLFGVQSASQFAAVWAGAEQFVQRFGFASISQFTALWTSGAAIGAQFGFVADMYYEDVLFAYGLVTIRYGIEAAASFLASWTATAAMNSQFGFTTAAQFFEEWEGALTAGSTFVFTSGFTYLPPAAISRSQTFQQAFGFRGVSAFGTGVTSSEAASFTFNSDAVYLLGHSVGEPIAAAFGFSSDAALLAAWTRDAVLATRYGFRGSALFSEAPKPPVGSASGGSQRGRMRSTRTHGNITGGSRRGRFRK